MLSPFYFSFPAIRGIQSKREYYVTMCPMELIPKMLIFDDEELEPEFRAQRVLNKARVPEICDYLVKNPTEYVLSALTASIDGDVEFIPINNDPAYYNIGTLKIPMSAKFVINDGQHRRAAIAEAIKKRPELRKETISCVFFLDTGLKRSQQMFADLNRYAIRPTQSLSILYDYRDPYAQLVKELIKKIDVFDGMIEMDKTTISNRSVKLFTLSGIYRATRELLIDNNSNSIEKQLEISIKYWSTISKYIPEWKAAKDGLVSASELRKEYIHAHTVTLVALGRTGRCLIIQEPLNWGQTLSKLKTIDWRRTNAIQWEGRAIIGGKVSISHNNITLLTNVIKLTLGLPLNEEEQQAEIALSEGLKTNNGGYNT